MEAPSPRPYRREMMVDFNNLNTREFQLIRESRLNDLNKIRVLSAYSLIPLTLLSFLGGYLITSKLLSPISELNNKISNLNAKNLGQEIEFEDTGDEISNLIKNFNSMSKNIAQSFRHQKEFVENASHELKTPLSAISLNIQSILNDEKISKKDIVSTLKEAKNSVEFMNKLTEDLLLLSLMEQIKVDKKIKASDLISDLKKYSSKDFNIIINIKKDFDLFANIELLKKSLENIVENSIKYSQGDELKIFITKEKNIGVIMISDNGKGIDYKYKDRIFDRFFRVDRSRSRKTGGSGLGLSIAKEIIERHNGTITLEKSDVGARFKLVFQI